MCPLNLWIYAWKQGALNNTSLSGGRRGGRFRPAFKEFWTKEKKRKQINKREMSLGKCYLPFLLLKSGSPSCVFFVFSLPVRNLALRGPLKLKWLCAKWWCANHENAHHQLSLLQHVSATSPAELELTGALSCLVHGGRTEALVPFRLQRRAVNAMLPLAHFACQATGVVVLEMKVRPACECFAPVLQGWSRRGSHC